MRECATTTQHPNVQLSVDAALRNEAINTITAVYAVGDPCTPFREPLTPFSDPFTPFNTLASVGYRKI
eukprot:10108610-Heterocapsa_arctica.AAC.1